MSFLNSLFSAIRFGDRTPARAEVLGSPAPLNPRSEAATASTEYYEAVRSSPDRTAIPYYGGGMSKVLMPFAPTMDALHRDRLAGLARYAVDNYGTAFLALDLICNYAAPIIPRGATKDATWNNDAETLFDDWVESCEWSRRFSYGELCRMASIAVDVDGDIGVSAENDGGLFRLRVWPGWRIGSAITGQQALAGEYDGVLLDADERVTGYRVLLRPNEWRIYPSNQFLLLCERENMDRFRGISALRRGLNDLRDAQDTKAMEKLAAKIDSAIAGVIEGPPVAASDWEDSDGDPVAVSTGTTPSTLTVAELLGGEIPVISGELKQLGGGRGSAKLEFIDRLGGWFVAGLGIPPAFFLDEKLTGPNLRAVIGKAQRKFDTRKETLARLAKWTWVRFISDQIQKGNLTAVAGWNRVRIQSPARISIDLGDQAAADSEAVKNGNLSRQRFHASSGQNWVDEVDQIQAEDDYIFAKAKEQSARTGVPLETILARYGYVLPQPKEQAPPKPAPTRGQPVGSLGDGLEVFDLNDKHYGKGAKGGQFAPKGYGDDGSDKSTKAKESHKPNTACKNAISNRAADLVAKAIGGEATRLNAPFDVLHQKANIELKGVMSNSNAKLTMHSPEAHDPVGSLNRKVLHTKVSARACATVAFACPDLKGYEKRYPNDFKERIAQMDGSNWTWYAKAGVGSFRMHTMTKLKGMGELNAWLNSNSAALDSERVSLMKKNVAFFAGLRGGQELRSYKAKVKSFSGDKQGLSDWVKSFVDQQVAKGAARRTPKGIKPLVDFRGRKL